MGDPDTRFGSQRPWNWFAQENREKMEKRGNGTGEINRQWTLQR